MSEESDSEELVQSPNRYKVKNISNSLSWLMGEWFEDGIPQKIGRFGPYGKRMLLYYKAMDPVRRLYASAYTDAYTLFNRLPNDKLKQLPLPLQTQVLRIGKKRRLGAAEEASFNKLVASQFIFYLLDNLQWYDGLNRRSSDRNDDLSSIATCLEFAIWCEHEIQKFIFSSLKEELFIHKNYEEWWTSITHYACKIEDKNLMTEVKKIFEKRSNSNDKSFYPRFKKNNLPSPWIGALWIIDTFYLHDHVNDRYVDIDNTRLDLDESIFESKSRRVIKASKLKEWIITKARCHDHEGLFVIQAFDAVDCLETDQYNDANAVNAVKKKPYLDTQIGVREYGFGINASLVDETVHSIIANALEQAQTLLSSQAPKLGKGMQGGAQALSDSAFESLASSATRYFSIPRVSAMVTSVALSIIADMGLTDVARRNAPSEIYRFMLPIFISLYPLLLLFTQRLMAFAGLWPAFQSKSITKRTGGLFCSRIGH